MCFIEDFKYCCLLSFLLSSTYCASDTEKGMMIDAINTSSSSACLHVLHNIVGIRIRAMPCSTLYNFLLAPPRLIQGIRGDGELGINTHLFIGKFHCTPAREII
jgi:hypothetical protein